MTYTVRPSSLPLLLKCPASRIDPEIRIDEEKKEADLGSACHQAIAQLVAADESIAEVNYPAIAARWGVDAEEVELLANMAHRLWEEHLRTLFPAFVLEKPLELEKLGDMVIKGTPDVINPGPLRVLDWKFGRRDQDDYSDQIKAYATLLWLNDPSEYAQDAEGYLVWVRDGDLETYKWTPEQLVAFVDQVHGAVQEPNRYVPGDHCGWCSRRHECEARRHLVKNSIRTLSSISIDEMTPTEVVDLKRRLTLIDNAVKEARSALKQFIIDNGPQDSGDGYRLAIAERERRSVLPLQAWPILVSQFTDQEMASFLSVKITGLQDAVRKSVRKRFTAVPRGQIGKEIAELFARLDDAEAIVSKTTTELKEVRYFEKPDAD